MAYFYSKLFLYQFPALFKHHVKQRVYQINFAQALLACYLFNTRFFWRITILCDNLHLQVLKQFIILTRPLSFRSFISHRRIVVLIFEMDKQLQSQIMFLAEK